MWDAQAKTPSGAVSAVVWSGGKTRTWSERAALHAVEMTRRACALALGARVMVG